MPARSNSRAAFERRPSASSRSARQRAAFTASPAASQTAATRARSPARWNRRAAPGAQPALSSTPAGLLEVTMVVRDLHGLVELARRDVGVDRARALAELLEDDRRRERDPGAEELLRGEERLAGIEEELARAELSQVGERLGRARRV